MRKRMLAFLCVLALLMGMYVVPASAVETNTAEGGFQVGYAKEDINPWMTNSSVYGVSGVPLPEGMTTSDAAYTNYTVSLSGTYVYKPSNNTYFRTGRTIIKVPMAGYANSTERLSTGIQDDNGDGYTGYGDGLFITCTTVTDANGYTLFLFTSDTVSGYSNLQKDVAKEIAKKISGVSTNQVTLTGSHTHGGPDFNVLRNAKINRTNALWAAYYDYVVDKMVNAAVSAYNGRQEATMSRGGIDASDSSGYQLNKIRQYLTKQYKNNKATGVEFISGAHLNTYSAAGKAINGYTYKQTSIADADDTLYILQFAIEGQKPIILVNWRAHATTTTENSNLGLSSDYVNSFRYAMEQAGYRVAFFQGAAGNIVTNSSPWVTEQNISNDLEEAVYYGGTLLAGVALDCLAGDNMHQQTGNIIRATHVSMRTQAQTYSEGLIAAANDYKTNGHSGYHPKPYKHTDGKYYYVNSSSHANAIVKTSTTSTLNLSTFLLGDGVAILTSPNEMYDRYSLEVDTLAEAKAATDNDWYDLKTSAYGMPFVFGYTNGHAGYLGDYMSYNYNADFEYPTTYTNGTIDGTYGVGIGSYETNSSRYAQGTGEAVVAMYGEMLYGKTAVCEHCGGKAVKWTALTAGKANADSLAAGHYYLYEDISYDSAIYPTGDVCLDLNGHTITTNGPAFKFEQADSEFSIMDSVGTGGITSYANGWDYGGVIRVYNTETPATTVFNLYGGTLQAITPEDLDAADWVGKGGVACVYGVMNMYGGTIKGGKVAAVGTSNSNNRGGSIYLYENSTLHISGGTIESGSIQDGGMGKCVFINSNSSQVTLSGNATVGEIYIHRADGDEIIVEDFTGAAELAVNTANIAVTEEGVDIGTVNGTLPSTLGCADEQYCLQKDDTDLILRKGSGVVRIGNRFYADIDTAINEYDSADGSYLKLMASVDTIDVGEKTVYLDMNGHDVENVEGTGALYCMDSETDDYLVDADNQTGYGKITGTIADTVTVDGAPVGARITQNTTAVPVRNDGYLMVTEDAVGTSFHRVNLQLTHISLRTQTEEDAQIDQINPSVYYKSAIGADAVVANLIDTFGVALSVKAKPAANNLETDCEYSRFAGSKLRAGENNTAITSTLLYGVMRESDSDSVNDRNANLPINASAYIKLTDGQYLFGNVSSWSLRQLLEGKTEDDGAVYDGIDALWETLTASQQRGVLAMYKTYKPVMENWDLVNIKSAQAKEDETLKVLVVGNSHSGDSTHLLHEVFETEAPGQKVVLGVLYHSGCSIHFHNQYMQKGEAAYTYYKNGDYSGANADGTWQTTPNATADVGLTDEQWDIVIMQQMSRNAAWDDGYDEATIKSVIHYIENKVDNPDMKLAWNMVWSSPDDDRYFTHGSGYTYSDPDSVMSWKNVHDTRFPGEDGTYDQSVMYEGMASCTETYIAGDVDFLGKDYFVDVIPSGTAVEYLQDVCGMDQLEVYRDYTHLSDYSRLMVAYLWYAKLMQIYTDAAEPTALASIGMDTIPTQLQRNSTSKYPADGKFDAAMLKDIRNAVNWALQNPYTLDGAAES